jgi:hypothetical protein
LNNDKKKDEVQLIINKIIDSNFRGIVLSSVRSGKTRILLSAIGIHSQAFNKKVAAKKFYIQI